MALEASIIFHRPLDIRYWTLHVDHGDLADKVKQGFLPFSPTSNYEFMYSVDR